MRIQSVGTRQRRSSIEGSLEGCSVADALFVRIKLQSGTKQGMIMAGFGE